jgi:DNA-binding LacI/PurR family transcriptional regulator
VAKEAELVIQRYKETVVMSQDSQDVQEAQPKVSQDSSPSIQRIPTSADIARHAGVSRATVSYVLNNTANSRVSEETRMRVRAAAEELGYTPHAMARSLRAGSTNLILFPLPLVQIDFIFYTLITDALKTLGYTILFYPEPPLDGESSFHLWASLRPAGVLLDSAQSTPTDQALTIFKTAGVRGIVLRDIVPSPLVPTLLYDQVQVGRLVAEYLLSRGHRTLGMILPPSGMHVRVAQERFKGFAQVAQAHGVSAEPIDLLFEEKEVRTLARQWREQPHPTGIFTYSDDYAALLLQAFLDAGLSIPEDVALVGSDDTPLCTILQPQLSTIHFSIVPEAGRVAQFFDDIIRGRVVDTPTIPMITPVIVSRASS